MVEQSAPRSPPFVNVLRKLALGVGGFLLVLMAALIVREQIPWAFAEAGEGERWARVLLMAMSAILWCLIPWFWLRRVRRRALGSALLLVFLLIGWLAWDDPVLKYSPDDYLAAPDWPGAEESYALVLRYPTHDEPDLPEPLRMLHEPTAVRNSAPLETEAWRAFLQEHREDIMAGWTALAAQREWVAEMAREPRLADLATSLGAPFVSFRQLRPTARFMTWHAGLLALDGRGDEALAELTILLEASQKLIPESRMLVRVMIARILNKMALQATDFVLDVGETTSAGRVAFLAVLQERPDPVDTARRMIWCEYPLGAKMLLSLSSDNDALRQMAHGRAVLYNPRNTCNQQAEILRTLSEHAARRQVEAMNEISNVWVSPSFYLQVKNATGRILISLTLPAFTKVVSEHWKIEDMAVVLETRLQSGETFALVGEESSR